MAKEDDDDRDQVVDGDEITVAFGEVAHLDHQNGDNKNQSEKKNNERVCE